MRVSTAMMAKLGLNAILDQQSALSRTQQQLGTGKRVLQPADDPAAAVRIQDLNAITETLEQFQVNAQQARARLELEESTLIGAGDILQRARELAVQANSASRSNEDRQALAAEVRGLIDQLLAVANTQDAAGDYLYAGHKARTQPFTRTGAGTYSYNGDDGERFVQIGSARQVSSADAGSDVFVRVRNGNGTFVVGAAGTNTGSGVIDNGSVVDASAYQGHDYRIVFTAPGTFDVIDDTTATTVLSAQPYTDGQNIQFDGIEVTITGAPASGDTFTVAPSAHQDLFTTLDRLASAMEINVTDAAGQAQVHQGIGRALGELDQGLEKLLEVRATVGARLNAIDQQGDINEDLIVQARNVQSELGDVDMVEAASRFSQQVQALEAAQQAYLRIQSLSLFRLLG